MNPKKLMPIADLHCDLLCYLSADASRTAYDPEVRCAIPQLQAGGVKMQTMAVFTRTIPHSSVSGLKQLEFYQQLLTLDPTIWQLLAPGMEWDQIEENKIGCRLAIENASGLCDEQEPLQLIFERLDRLSRQGHSPLYIGFTWNEENRFGGGSSAPTVGLKTDGKRLLDYMHQKGIAMDFSHASDPLIEEALAYMDQKQLQIPVLASHSNFRSIQQAARNLPDELAIEIAKRNGLIGINFYQSFVGDLQEGSSTFLKHLEHAFRLGIQSSLCFGADFFYDGDLPPRPTPRPPCGFPGYETASCYPKLLQEWEDASLERELLEGICYKHLDRFLKEYVECGDLSR